MSALYAKRAMHGGWETPPHLFALLDAEFHFTLDAAASQENAKCARYFSKVDDGLAQDWGRELVWLNPPYGDHNLRAWMRKAVTASRAGALVVAFVPANTSTVWWNDFAPLASEIRWVRGRVKFVGAKGTAPFASCFLIYRPPVGPIVARVTAA